MSEPTGWFPAFTLLLGYGTKYLSDWFQHTRAVERERETRRETRRDVIAERRTQFQRQTLLDLQPALLDLARNAGKMHVHDLKGYRATNRFHAELYPSDVDEGFRAASALTSMLAVRVNDERVRMLTAAFKSAASDVGVPRVPTIRI